MVLGEIRGFGRNKGFWEDYEDVTMRYLGIKYCDATEQCYLESNGGIWGDDYALVT